MKTTLNFMAKKVDLARLAEALRDYQLAYLVTVGDDYRPHTAAVTPSYDAGLLDVGPVGRHGWANLAARRTVTLVWPARGVSEYALIVDGQTELPDDPAGPIRIRPTSALLHRPVLRDDGERAVGGVYDCVQLTEPG